MISTFLTDSISSRIKQALEERVFPGCVVGVVFSDGEKVVLPYGRFTYDQNAEVVKVDSIFDVASVTKSIPTNCLALQLIDEGVLHLDDLVVSYVPEFSGMWSDEVTIRHLLTWGVDYYPKKLSTFKGDFERTLEVVLKSELNSKPGSTYVYYNHTQVLLTLVLKRVSGKSLDVLADERFFSLLGMNDSTFHPKKLGVERVVPTEFDAWRGRLVQAEVHDESAFTLQEKMISGHAGLFSTAPDLLVFLEMLLGGGVYRGRRFFREEIIREMYTNQFRGEGSSSVGLGWEIEEAVFMGPFAKRSAIAKTGFTGCLVLCDFEDGVGVVLLSNRVYPKRPENNLAINLLRRDICSLIYTEFV
jgi:CubicO group peptidase (beta-lactamase class C family)